MKSLLAAWIRKRRGEQGSLLHGHQSETRTGGTRWHHAVIHVIKRRRGIGAGGVPPHISGCVVLLYVTQLPHTTIA